MLNHIYLLLLLAGLPIFAFMFYNLLISLAGFRRYHHYQKHQKRTRFCAVVAARNEEGVIGQLVDTLVQADYPKELFDVYVIPNNCTDQTGAVAKEHGAKVYDPVREIHSKGEALNEFFDYIFNYEDHYDAFCVFDADNLVDPNFFSRMNDAIAEGVDIAQGYREAKNPKDSWISGSQSIFYYIINRFMNEARLKMGLSACLNGTGFMVSRDILEESGFTTFTLTEDIEFSTQNILKGRKVHFVPDAITYDEHPVDQKTSIKQRKRWSTGTIQTLYHYGPELWEKFKETKNFRCLDMIIYLLSPYFQVMGMLYSMVCLLVYLYISVRLGQMTPLLIMSIAGFILSVIWSVGFTALTIRMEKHAIKEVNFNSFLSFWYFIISWSFINFEVFFRPIKSWEPIEHQRGMELADLQGMSAEAIH